MPLLWDVGCGLWAVSTVGCISNEGCWSGGYVSLWAVGFLCCKFLAVAVGCGLLAVGYVSTVSCGLLPLCRV